MSKMKYVKDFDFGEKACNYQCGGPVMAMAKGGGVKEAKTGEMYSSRKAMAKHERTESPRMQKEEMMKSQHRQEHWPSWWSRHDSSCPKGFRYHCSSPPDACGSS
jgi:hypothetical protein